MFPVEKRRIGWVDAAKGMAIFLVVLGHNPLPGIAIKLIYALNVPIFFMMSGYTFNSAKYPSLFSLIKRLFFSVLVPYVIMNLLAFPIYYLARGQAVDLELFLDVLGGMAYGVGTMQSLRVNIPLWFLPCIFVVQCLWYLIDRYGGRIKVLLVLSASLIGYFMPVFVPVRLPWGADVALTGVVFFALGGLLRQRTITESMSKSRLIIAFLLLLGLNLVFNLMNKAAAPNVDLNILRFGNYILFYLCALCGCGAIIAFAHIVQRSWLLGCIGRNTLWILGLHSIFIQIFEVVLKVNIISIRAFNSLFLTVLEIVCVLLLKLVYDGIRTVMARTRALRESDGKTMSRV